MEKYVGKCRLILICENVGKVIAPLRSRCLLIRLRAPDRNEMKTILEKIAKFENLVV